MTTPTEEELAQIVDEIDAVIFKYPHWEAHNIAGILLSRVTLLMTMDPSVGKELVKYVWEKLDEIEQADPGNML